MAARRGLLLLAALVLGAACSAGDPPAATPTAQPSPQPTVSIGPGPTGTLTSEPTSEPTIQPTPATPGPKAAPTAEPLPAFGEGPLAWTELDNSGGPSAREYHTFTLDGTGEVAYLFGGRAGSEAFNEFWRYDLANDTWQLIEPSGPQPEPRFGHVAVWQPEMGLVIWSGQQSATVFFGDIWAFDPVSGSWSELPDAGEVPEARYGSCGSIGPDGRLWISHGFTEDSGRFFDTRAYDFETLSWADLTPSGAQPVLRCLHDCLWTPDGRYVLYAGQTTGVPALGDLWSYEPSAGAWSQADSPAAPPRNQYALAQIGRSAFIFGGQGTDRAALDDLWRLDLDSLAMSQPDAGSGPPARWGATLIGDEARQRLLLFGGLRQSGELADLWVLSAAQP